MSSSSFPSFLMMMMIIILFFSSSSLQFFSFVQISYAKTPYTVHVYNNITSIPNLITAHCFSGESDLKYHNLTQNQNFDWSFQENIGYTTEFFCHFWWRANLEGQFSAFNHHLAVNNCKSRHCYWIVKETGFHLTDDIRNPNPRLVYIWNIKS